MGLQLRVHLATISSSGLARVPIAKVVVLVGFTVRETWDLVVLIVETAVVWDRVLKALAYTAKVMEMVQWEAKTMVWFQVVALWVVGVEDHRIVLFSKAVVAAVEMLVNLKFTLGI